MARFDCVAAVQECPDQSAVDELVVTHVPIVAHLVSQLLARLPAHANRDDLMSAGTLGLVLAARGFDATRGVPFACFAAIRIKGALNDELRAVDWASRGVRTKAREIEQARITVTAQLGRTPTRLEVSQALGCAPGDLDRNDADVRRAGVFSLQALTPDNVDEVIASTELGPESALLAREEIGYLRDAVAELPPRLRLVVEQYFFANQKMRAIAAEMGITESRVSQLRSEALAYLRLGMRYTDDLATLSCEPATDAAPLSDRRAPRADTARLSYCAAVRSRTRPLQRV